MITWENTNGSWTYIEKGNISVQKVNWNNMHLDLLFHLVTLHHITCCSVFHKWVADCKSTTRGWPICITWCGSLARMSRRFGMQILRGRRIESRVPFASVKIHEQVGINQSWECSTPKRWIDMSRLSNWRKILVTILTTHLRWSRCSTRVFTN